jgi:hypothetical protein
MIPRPFAELASVGVSVPPRVVTNHDLAKTLDTSDEWIVERTGIRERRIAGPEQSVAMLSREASEKAMERAGVTATDLDSIVLGTASPDRLLPSTACDLQALLGATNAAAFDVSAACPGFVYALTVAEGLIASARAGPCWSSAPRSCPPSPTSRTAPRRSSSVMVPGPASSGGARGTDAACSPPSSSPTGASRRCCIGPAAAPRIRSASG